MIDTIIDYLLFIGSGLYIVASLMFLYIFIKAMKTKDGVGLSFLKILSFGIFLGSLVIFTIRVLSEYGSLDYLTARAIAIVNPIILVGIVLYLNFLLHNSKETLTKTDSKNISEMKKDVEENNKNIKIIKNKQQKEGERK